MRFNFLALALLPAVLATPLPTPTPSNTSDAAIEARDGVVVVPMTPRGKPNVYRCDQAGWNGRCFLVTNPSSCHNWAGEPGEGSFGPDKGLTCRVWGFPGCTGPLSASISYPGTGNNQAFAAQHGMVFSSWKCSYD